MEQLHIREPQAKMPMAHFRIMQLEPDKTVILQNYRQITDCGNVRTLPQDVLHHTLVWNNPNISKVLPDYG